MPKSLALRKAEVLAVAVAGPMDAFILLTRPIVRLMKWSARMVMRLFGMDMMEGGEVHSPEELKLIATASRRMGLLPAFQESLIHRAVELNNVPTREVMTPPAEDLLPAPGHAAGRRQCPHRGGAAFPCTRPMTRRTAPSISSGLHIPKISPGLCTSGCRRRLVLPARRSPNCGLGQVMHDVLVVPETKPVLDLLIEFQSRRRHIAIVVDEYGSTVGLVTVEDAIEQIIGEVEDEFDIGPRAALQSTAGAVVLDGGINLRDLETQMNWNLPRTGGVETLAGFLLSRLGKIPTGEETVDFEGRRFTVVKMDNHRISQVRVERLETAAGDAGCKTGSPRCR